MLACIAVADATRARLFVYRRSTDAEGVHEELVEHLDLVDPQRRLRPSELFSDSFVFDDHRDAHLDAFDDEFARSIGRAAAALVRATGARRLVVCASPHMLGALRSAIGVLHGATIDDIPRDIVRLPVHALRDQLAEYELLPPR